MQQNHLPATPNSVQTPYQEKRTDWSFADLKRSETLWGPHGYHRYPAKFIPQLVAEIIETYSNKGELVGDSFMGSGTTGIESLRLGRRFWGADISPIALLISQAKCVPLQPRTLDSHWADIEKRLSKVPHVGRRALTDNEKTVILAFNHHHASIDERLDYWFPKAHRQALEAIFEEISTPPINSVRRFFLCAFSNILRACSIWLSGSTKAQKDLGKTLADPAKAFSMQVRRMLKGNNAYWTELSTSGLQFRRLSDYLQLEAADARSLSIEDSSLDLLVTSPPYATCYQYAEIHQLTQLWFGHYGILKSNDWTFSCIGAKSLNGHAGVNPLQIQDVSETASKIFVDLEQANTVNGGHAVHHEVTALHNYFDDMCLALREFSRIVKTGRNLVLIVGDSQKLSKTIPTTVILSEIAAAYGFQLEQKITRKIPARVLVSKRDSKTGRFSSANESDSEVYPEENILVLKARSNS